MSGAYLEHGSVDAMNLRGIAQLCVRQYEGDIARASGQFSE
jgi:hypothetical protein